MPRYRKLMTTLKRSGAEAGVPSGTAPSQGSVTTPSTTSEETLRVWCGDESPRELIGKLLEIERARHQASIKVERQRADCACKELHSQLRLAHRRLCEQESAATAASEVAGLADAGDRAAIEYLKQRVQRQECEIEALQSRVAALVAALKGLDDVQFKERTPPRTRVIGNVDLD